MPHRRCEIGSLKFLAGLMILLLSACNAGQGSQPASRVLAAETWLADIARNVAGDRMAVDSLLPPGVDPHEFQPAPQDAIKLARAKLLIVNGLGYETWLQKSLQDAGAELQVATASEGLSPAGDDPHMWMDPNAALRYVTNIRDALTRLDPAGKETYAANAAAYSAKLRDVDAAIKAQVASIPPERRLLVTNHDALGYFARAYGFQVVGAVIPSVTNEASPSAQQMAALVDAVRRTHAPAIFLDASENPRLAEQVASSTGAHVVTDLYVETLSPPGGPAPSYIEMLQHDASSITQALR